MLSIPYGAELRRYLERIPPRRRLPIAGFVIPETVLLLWWAAFFPGGESYDTITYVWHVTTDHWMSNHSVVYDSLVWLSLNTTGDLWALTLLQTVAFSATVSYTCVMLRDFGVRARWSLTAAAAVVIVPSTGTFVVFVWKDVPYSIGALLAFAATGRLLARRLRGRLNLRDTAFRREMGLLFLGCLSMGVFRNNGLLVVVFAAPVLLIVLPKVRRWVLGIAVVSVAISAGLQLVVYPAVGIKTPTKDGVYALNYADIGYAYTKAPKTFSHHDKMILKQVAPLSHWSSKKATTCYDADNIMRKPMNRPVAAELNGDLLHIWGEVAKRTPNLLFEARMCRSHIAWAIWQGPRNVRANTLISEPVPSDTLFSWLNQGDRITHNPYLPKLTMRPLSTELNTAATFAFRASEVSQLDWLLFRGAIWTYAAYAVAILLSRKRRKSGLLGLMALSLGLQLCVMSANPAPLFRYVVAPMFIGAFMLPLLSVRNKLDRITPDAGSADAAAAKGDATGPSEGKPLTAGVI
jgi:hypothetical protein